jgi:Xaa-Pro aminopeptidase
MSDARLTRARALLAARNVDALVISNAYSRRYLTGYTAEDHPPDESAGVAIVTHDRAVLITSKNNVEWAKEEAPGWDVLGQRYPWAIDVAEVLTDAGAKVVGFEEEALSVRDFKEIESRSDGSWILVPLDASVTKLRIIKDDVEVTHLAQAAAVTDASLLEALARLDEGMTELQLARELEDAMRRLGSAGPGFGTIVASGPNAARPHHANGHRKISAGEPVVIDMGALWEGYTADLTRTVCLGDPTPKLQTVYNIVLNAQQAVLDGVRGGMLGKDVDALARDVITAAGYGPQFIHGLGHGVGLQIHEGPSAGQRSTDADVIEAGMSLTVEPGIYIADWGGVRIEDLLIITESGSQNLTTAPKVPAVRDMLAGVKQ